MATNPTSELTWYRKPFGRRVSMPEHPFFSMAHPSDTDDGDALRRRQIADLAGL